MIVKCWHVPQLQRHLYLTGITNSNIEEPNCVFLAVKQLVRSKPKINLLRWRQVEDHHSNHFPEEGLCRMCDLLWNYASSLRITRLKHMPNSRKIGVQLLPDQCVNLVFKGAEHTALQTAANHVQGNEHLPHALMHTWHKDICTQAHMTQGHMQTCTDAHMYARADAHCSRTHMYTCTHT